MSFCQPELSLFRRVAEHETKDATTEFLSLLGELLCDILIHDPNVIPKVSQPDTLGLTDSAKAIVAKCPDHAHRLLVSILAERKARGLPSMPSLQWLAVASLSMPSLSKALAEKLVADSLETDLHKERGDILPILMELRRPDLRTLQLAVLQESLAHWSPQSRTAMGGLDDARARMAACILSLAEECISDLCGNRLGESAIGPRVAQRRMILQLHNAARRRVLPSPNDAREYHTPLEIREVFADIHLQLAYLSQIFDNGRKIMQHLQDALAWLDPSRPKYTDVKAAHDLLLLHAIQYHRKEHGTEIL